MPSGREIKAAAKKGSAWGTEVACGENDGVLLKGDTLKRSIKDYTDDSLGLAFPQERDLGEIDVKGALNAFLRYDSLDLLIALAMGATGGAPTQQGGTSAYTQKFTLAEDLDGLFATIAVNKAVNVFEYPSAKIAGFTIKGRMGEPVTIDFDVVCDDEDPAPTTNDLTQFGNVTYFETANRVLMSQGVFRMNAQGGAALGGGDVINPSSFDLSYKRKLTADYQAGGANKIIEPVNDGVPEIKLKLEFPRYSASTYLSDFGSDSRKKMDITFTGALIADTYYRTFKLTFPNLAILNVEAATKEGQIVHPLEFACLGASSAPTGMTGITMPFQVDVTNRQSLDVLA
jgi:hypothetical protein